MVFKEKITECFYLQPEIMENTASILNQLDLLLESNPIIGLQHSNYTNVILYTAIFKTNIYGKHIAHSVNFYGETFENQEI